eukprot:CAMPEP_0196774212 /NCGR_PEP_ID=MMETSP1104-20130614/3248_1 /TAXON_ID=33652 /ORGANISM="Cafeteria sp., Strain Caron Lab Isolate" /LENGTH=596 /DNA_ID=CAMNT_0042144365 /DNA_START=64 /DNA_END=1854 /DNA_ORIENTATION=-
MSGLTASTEEIARLEAVVAERGAKVREMKTSGADKAAVDAAVAELLEGKKQLALAKGEEWPPKKEKKSGKGGKEAAADESKEGEQKLSKKQLRILQKQKEAEERAAKAVSDAAALSDRFAELPLIQSREISDRVWTRVEDLADKAGSSVWVRGYLYTSRVQGGSAFVVVRQGIHSVQAVAFKGDNTPKAMLKFIEGISRESVVDVFGEVQETPEPVTGTTMSGVELKLEKIFVVSPAHPVLPFNLEDASRPEEEEGKEGDDKKTITVGTDLRLDYRWVDLRTQTNQAIMRIKSTVCLLFREFLSKRGFIEIQTPKLLGGASEGGAEVFRFKYFGREGCLAQSPQLYKQMCAACSGFERVFEVGPVFRAENSNTHRHLCEFTGLDFEMAIKEHYFEVLDVFSELFIYIFDGLNERCKAEQEIVQRQFPFEPIQYLRPSLRLTFAEGIKMLQDAGVEDVDPMGDLTTANEKLLGRLVREKYGTDFFILDKYPLAVRPFYTMPCPENPELSNSYDLFIRGEEIVSGAQRVHDVDLLVSRAEACGIPVHTIQGYVDSFRHGALPHGGGGIGLERVVMLFLGLNNIRKVAMFPRDPKRLSP